MVTTSSLTVGRKAELDLLTHALSSLQGRVGQAVFLSGDAGIGKSRLADECARRAAALGLPLLRGRGSASGVGGPFRPLAEALSSWLRRAGMPPDGEFASFRPALARLVPEWRTTAAYTAADDGLELAEALLRLLALLGREGGCVLVLEDLHDADAETVAVLEYLVDNLTELPVLVLATLRPEPGPAFELQQAVERRRVAAVRALAPLAPPQVRSLAAGCLGVADHEVPEAVVERLVEVGGGNPYLLEELLAAMVDDGVLRRSGPAWQVVGDLGATVPASVVRALSHRVEQFDGATRTLVLAAALLGPRFSAGTLKLVTALDEPSLLAGLRTAVAAKLIAPDGVGTDGYAFRHALLGEALLLGVAPVERTLAARSAAAALLAAPAVAPEQAEDRCHLAARLLETVGDGPAAARQYAEAGRRALADGTSGPAVRLLERAHGLAGQADRAEITESLVYALAEAGRLDRALGLLETLTSAGGPVLGVERTVALHTRLAWVAVIAERGAETAAQLAAARALLGPAAAPEQNAALAVVQGQLAMLPGHGEGLADAERQTRDAAEVAQRAGLPVLACQAWQLLAMLARERGFDEADACLGRMLQVAEAHDLPSWRFEALVRLGANAFMRTGEARALEEALAVARTLGSVTLAHRTESLLAMHAVLTCAPDRAREIIDRCSDATARMRTMGTHRYLLMTSATLAAHQGRRPDMERELQAFERAGGDRSFPLPVTLGLCRAVCALLEEDRGLAEAELAAAAAWEHDHPNVHYLAGRYGLHPLLDVLAGRAGRAEFAVVAATPAAELAWNRQFLRCAEAVLLGREGRPERAADVVGEVRSGAALFPTGSHLGLRLVAEAALADGWGEPVAWLRAAEDHFHAQGVPAVVAACRNLLRRAGATVAQRRTGRDLIPPALRIAGVTTREYQVLSLLTEQLGNQQLARRLVISPRTVEKHLASLIRKTGRPDRAALGELAAELGLGAGEPPH